MLISWTDKNIVDKILCGWVPSELDLFGVQAGRDKGKLLQFATPFTSQIKRHLKCILTSNLPDYFQQLVVVPPWYLCIDFTSVVQF